VFLKQGEPKMFANAKMGMHKKFFAGVVVAIVLSILLPVTKPQIAQAQAEEWGYLWSLYYSFDQDYNAVLTIEVGPWENGDLVEVADSSTATVRCEPVGNVALAGGMAVFKGGHLECAMDLREIVNQNHDLVIDEIDDYGSIIARTIVMSSANTVAPIFTHPDAQYSIDFTQTSSVKLNQQLWNGAGLLDETFFGVMGNTWQTYTMEYICNPAGTSCDEKFGVAGQTATNPVAGTRVKFNTGPMSFQVGGAAFNGRMDALLIDPGNSAH
jgi:hypothetical protein